jgi:dihydroxyacetone kinase
LIGALNHLPLADHTQLMRAIGQELSQTTGGSSGVLLAIFFTAAGDAAASSLPMNAALRAGLARMQKIGGANLGDRTMVDALKPALDELDISLEAAAKAARKGAAHTATLSKANAGHAAYISPEQLQGQTDPGAEAVARLFEELVIPPESKGMRK